MKAARPNRGKAAKRKPAKQIKNDGQVGTLMSEHGELIVCVALVIVVFLCFANALRNDFVFDDIYLVSVNNQIRSLNLPLLLSSYRPIRDISYAIDFALWGENPFGFHLTSILIHAANVLFTFFYLLAFQSYLTYYRNRWSAKAVACFILFLLLWMLSLLSKEMAVSLPILIFVWHFCDAWEEGTGSLWRRLWQTTKRTFNREKWFWMLISLAGIAFTVYWVVIKRASHRVGLGTFDYWGGSFYLNMLTVI